MCIRNNLRGGVRHDKASNPFLDGLQKTFERWSADVYEKKTKKKKPLSSGHDFALAVAVVMSARRARGAMGKAKDAASRQPREKRW